MTDYFFDLNDLFPYAYLFPIFIIIVWLFFVINKRNINNKTSGFYGLFMGLTNKNILSLALLFLYYYLMIVSIFINNFSLLSLIIFLVPIIIFNIMNFYFFKFLVDLVNTPMIFLLLYIKSIFYNYMIDVYNYWYVIVLYVLLCIFIFFYITFIFIKRFKSIVSTNKYIENDLKIS